MKKLTILATVLALGACGDKNTMTCGDYSVKVLESTLDTITTEINGDKVVLNIAVSASGAKYDGTLNETKVTLWSKGDNWSLMLNDGDMMECK
jgi:membrane-bound inhibitor of C-type lysozyme